MSKKLTESTMALDLGMQIQVQERKIKTLKATLPRKIFSKCSIMKCD
jgi:hypothetical protein